MDTYLQLMIAKNLFIYFGGFLLGVSSLAFLISCEKIAVKIPKVLLYLAGFFSSIALYYCFYVTVNI